MKRTILTSVLFGILAFGFTLCASAEVPHWKADEIKAGMTGDGYTVFHGHKREKFHFKVTGLQDTGEGIQFLVSVWRDVDGEEEPFNIASGMSGSPLYINGKLVAAIASGWETATSEGTAKPFQFMYEEKEQAARFRSLYRVVRDPFRDSISSDRRLKPGSSIKIGFVTGDQALSNYALGTVTAIDEETGTVFALGHSLETSFRKDAPSGPVSYTAWEGGVAGTVNDVGEKVPAWDAAKGQRARIWFNGVHGVYGTIDEVAETIPLVLEVKSLGYHKKANFEISYGTTTLGFAQTTTERFLNTYLESLGEITVDINGFIGIDGGQEIPIKERFSHSTLDMEPFSSIFLKRTYFFGSFSQLLLADNHIRFSGLCLLFYAQPLGPILTIRDVTLLKETISPGEQLSIVVQIAEKGNLKTSAWRYEPVITVPIPKDAFLGGGKVIVETGEAYLNRRPGAALPPTNLDGLIKNIVQNARNNASFYVTVLVPIEKKGEKIDRIKKQNENDAWRRLDPGETLFTESLNAFPPIRMTAPLPHAVIISERSMGRYELFFRIEPKPHKVFDSIVRIVFQILQIIIIFVCFQLLFFVAMKLNPRVDRIWGHVLSSIHRRWKS